jgi:hypothetical protein
MAVNLSGAFPGFGRSGSPWNSDPYSGTGNIHLFPHDCVHVKNAGGEMEEPLLHNRRLTLGVFPWLFKGGEAAFCRAVAG